MANQNGKRQCSNKRPDKSFPGFFGRKGNEPRASKKEAANVGEYVVAHHKRYWQDEPDQTVENVFDDKVGLDDHKQQSHMRPKELDELKSVMAILEMYDEKNEACGEKATASANPFDTNHTNDVKDK